MVELIEEAGVLHGYLEDQCFEPSIVRGREILWARGARLPAVRILPDQLKSIAARICRGSGRASFRAEAY